MARAGPKGLGAGSGAPGFLEPDKPASRWSDAYRRIVEQTYGQWLAWLIREGVLDETQDPGERVTDDRLRAFIGDLQARLSPWTVSMRSATLLRMLTVIAPEAEWTFLRRAVRHFKRAAVPTRDKLACMVPADELFDLGLHLMDTCEDGPEHPMYVATKFRDGLIIAILICAPMRLKNLERLEIGHHLLFDGHAYRIELTAAETKTGRPYRATLPDELTPASTATSGYGGR